MAKKKQNDSIYAIIGASERYIIARTLMGYVSELEVCRDNEEHEKVLDKISTYISVNCTDVRCLMNTLCEATFIALKEKIKND